MADLAAATFAIQTESVTAGTNQKAATAWRCWIFYLESIEIIRDVFLDSFSVSQRLQVILAFAAAMRQARFSMGYSKLCEGTVHSTIENVTHIFQTNNQKDP